MSNVHQLNGATSCAPRQDRLLRITDVMRITSLSRSSIYAYVKAGLFPAPLSLGLRCRRWLESAVYAWIDSRQQ